jgi:hypothetical protein
MHMNARAVTLDNGMDFTVKALSQDVHAYLADDSFIRTVSLS